MKNISASRLLAVLIALLGILLIVALVQALFASALGTTWANDLHSLLFADYSADPEALNVAPLNPAIIAEALRDLGGDGPTIDPTAITILLQTPVATATPVRGDTSPPPTGGTQVPSPVPSPAPTIEPTSPATPTPTATSTATSTPTSSPTSTSLPTATDTPTDPPPPPPRKTDTPVPTSPPPPPFTPTPDLVESFKVASPVEVMPNHPISYTVYIYNTGDVAASRVTVSDTYPFTLTLFEPSLFGPPYTTDPDHFLVEWGPFDVPARSQVTMGFTGTFFVSSNPPMGQRGEWVRNQAQISAPWLAAPLQRHVDVLALYPATIEQVAGTYSPASARLNELVTFQVDVVNRSGVATTLDTDDYLALRDPSATINLTTSLQSAVFVPADGAPHTLSFAPVHLTAVPPDPVQARLNLDWVDESGTPGNVTNLTVGQTVITAGARLDLVATPPAPITMTAGNAYPLTFYVWNTGPVEGYANYASSADHVTISVNGEWGGLTPLWSQNFNISIPACSGPGLWISDTISLPAAHTVHWTLTDPQCGNPYVWMPEPATVPPNNYYARFDVEADAPVVTGTYFITVQATLDGGTILTEETVECVVQ